MLKSKHLISALVSGSPKLQLRDPVVSSGLLGCEDLGYYNHEINGPTIGYSKTLETFDLVLGDLKP